MASPGTTDQETILQHPDFEMYDNVGRASGQITAAHSLTATDNDLLRWARRDAARSLVEHPLPGQPLPAPDPAPYLAALDAAKTPAEVSAVTQNLLDAAEPVMETVSNLLQAIAQWEKRHRGAEPGTPPRMLMSAASQVLVPLSLAHRADLAALRTEYDPPPTPPPKGAPRLPPAPPATAVRRPGPRPLTPLETLLSTASFVARPTPSGYSGVYIHFDGAPNSKMPFLLASFQYRFGRDLEAMTRHLVDDVAIGWEELGSDLLDGAPPEIAGPLTGGASWPSTTLDNLATPDGSPLTRMSVTEATLHDMGVEWGYVLRPEGIEVIHALSAASGPIVSWDTHPFTDFDAPGVWAAVAPARPAAPSTSSPRPAASGSSRTTARL
ncbi:hypothetical protein [Streptomyces sp. NPDC058861]|uniref:hypothetical protein n=1 Tax=Streptomyces sp. NPDC058861 TaxID=3346653 RepID=UPI0036A4EBE8